MRAGFLLQGQTANKSETPHHEIPTESKLCLDDFEIDRLLGEGNYSKVFAVTRKSSGRRYAMKTVNTAQMNKLNKDREILMEKHCLLKLNPDSYLDKTRRSFSDGGVHDKTKLSEMAEHGREHIVKLFHTFKGDSELYFISELCDGDELWYHTKGVGLLSKDTLVWCLHQVICAMKCIHESGIVHRDIKAENIVRSSGGILKFIDFGTAMDVNLSPEDTLAGQSRRREFQYFAGTPHFMAPEARRNDKASSFQSDLWSLGALIYQLCTGAPPFNAPSDFLVFTRAHFLDLDVPCYLRPEILEVIQLLLKLVFY